ncbi:hypothetical protein [Anthocerotibacter panamensis]|uniref:hypothetical protein n=1 Tax=Anthocerotibacter panamensis TaxID=2857077 RepID=UPI001C406B60|nr:hypothetical protein [Anthocerotibacter panamensis]
MSSTDAEVQLQELTAALRDLERDPTRLNQLFMPLQEQVRAESPLAGQLTQILWEEVLRTKRSLNFWRSLGEAEGELAKTLCDQNIRLQQNYLRLMQEQ